ncbi:polyketide synthase [Chaetomium strumarium]|uniref:Polyketide synthase n=1 Tax=Chaetomium strumarium TaxID=1170767 RepID=A0AAJ0LZX4_9PEZI|nr:polyketide synthase [Chaetomium strumarium]
MATNTSSTAPDGSVQHYQVLLFGDLSSSRVEEDLWRLLHTKTNPVLASFFTRLAYGLRKFIGGLPAREQDLFPHFTTLVDLVSRLGDTKGTPVLRFFALCVYELALFIAENENGARAYPSPGGTYVIGPCTGGFAAAAVSCSQTLTDLVPLAIEAALAAFRTALCSWLAGQDISPTVQSEEADAAKSWSAIAVRSDAKLYISATTPSHVATISGPPSTLQDLLTQESGRLRVRYLDIQSPFHASGIFDESDVDDIVDHISDDSAAASKPLRLRLLSPSTGESMTASGFKAVIRDVVRETLQRPVRWERVATRFRSLLAEAEASECTIVPFASNAAPMLSMALSIHGITPGGHPPGVSGAFEHSKIAIIGYSGRFPDADSNEAFWELLRAGRDVHREIPPDRFDWKAHYDPTGKQKNTSRVKYGCFIEEPGMFDARFFNMSPREAENTDPAQRLAITTTYEAMEMAGLVRNRTPSTQQDRVGVFFGTTSDDWREVNSGQDVDTYFIPGGNRAFVPGRISYFFRFSGPSLSIDTACSSSFAAIQSACNYLWRGDVDTAIAGGTNVLTNPDNFAGLDRGHFLSTTGNCNAFDDGASGYCRADAVATVILKRLEDAEADNDPIFGVIVGTATNHCGQTDSITRPHEGDQASVFKRIMRYADVDPLDISYVEMHGTGTQAGDATEMNSVLSVFVPHRKRTDSSPQRPLYLGSAKANIGHAESASGVSSLIKVLMMMKHSEIPPHCGIKTRINHNYPQDLSERGVRIAFNPTPWRREDSVSGKRAVFLNNFSAAGGNTAVLLEDAPAQDTVDATVAPDPRPVHLVAVTAKTAQSLAENLNGLLSWLEANPQTSLPALSYTTTARRMHHNYRTMVSGTDTASIMAGITTRLLSLNQVAAKPIPAASKTPNVVFTFTGQGTLYSGMGKSLYTTNPSFRADMLRFNRLATDQGFPAFIGLIDGSHAINNAKEVSVVASHLALTCVQMALARFWQSLGVTASAVVGHSLGEYAALYVAGVISAADAVYLVGRRAALLEEHCTPGTHAMLAVKTTADVIGELIQEGGSQCEVACANQPAGHVISGRLDNICEVEKLATAKGLRSVRLDLPFAFHSAQVEPILAPFETAASQGVVYRSPQIPVLSPLLSRPVQAGEHGVLDASYLAKAFRAKVDFAGAVEAAKTSTSSIANERTVWLEIGVHPACSDMVKGTLGSDCTTLATLRRDADAYKTLAAALESLYLAGFNIEWNEYHRNFPAARKVVQLPRYSWDLKKYWIPYRNNFCLAKGEGLVPATEAANAQHKLEATTAAPQYKYLSPSVQRVLEERHGADRSSLLVESDIFDDRLLPVLQGHVVNGAHLAPSSLYADVAITMAHYMLQGAGMSTETTGIDVTDVKVDAPLIAQPDESTHLFRVSATADWGARSISMSIYSVDGNGKRTRSHATLDARIFPEQRWLDEWRRNTHLILSRIEALNQGIHSGESHKLKRGMVYKLFGAIVVYSSDYQGMKEVVLDSERLEAVSTVNFQVGDGGFVVNPRWIDSLGGIAGFIMNGNDAVDSEKQVFINHGWERLRIAERLDATKTYYAYNRMQLVEKTLYAGDTYILHEGRIVAIFEGVKFQGVPRRVLDHALPPRKAVATVPPVNAPSRATGLSEMQPRQPLVVEKEPRKPRTLEPSRPEPKAERRTSSGLFDHVLSVICQEVGLSPTELKPASEFADFGLDSLLSLTITARIRDELQRDLPSSIFIECPTVANLQTWLDDQAPDSGSSGVPTPHSRTRSRSVSSRTSDETHITAPTPREDGSVNSGKVDSDSREATLLVLRQTITDETGVPLHELAPSTCLGDIGVDSLLALTITAQLRDLLGDAVPSTLFMENETLQEVERALTSVLGLSEETSGSLQMESILSSPPHATSVLLSGNARTAASLLFWLPDGSGSATSYAALGPCITDTVAVYGLNCPWRKTAEEMTRLGVDMAMLAAKYVAEIQRLLAQRNQHIPVAIGGWSAGGIIAVEAARQLRGSRQSVDKLVLLDSPNPIGLQNPPQRMYDFFDSIGLFGGGRNKMPDWLRAHFSAFINILDKYEPTPLADAPPTLIVYARDGVCKDPNGPRPEMRPDDPREMLWLLNNRTDFSADGWASLLGRDRLTIRVLDDVNHFSLMDPGPTMKRLGQVVGDFLG